MADQWASTEDHAPKADSGWADTSDHSPAPSAVHEFGQGVLDTTVRGLVDTVKKIAPKSGPIDIPGIKQQVDSGNYFDAAKKAVRESIEHLPGGQLVTGLIDSSIDQAKKAHEDFTRGEYSRAALHAGAAAVPLAAGGVDTALGSEAKFDKYGNVTQEAVEPNAPRALGQATGLGISVAAPKVFAKTAKSNAPSAKSVTITPRVVPQLTAEEEAAVKFAQERGIPVPASVATGNKALSNVESYLSNAPGSAGVMKKAAAATREAVQRVGNDIVEQPGAGRTDYPVYATPETAGEAVQAGQSERNLAIEAAGRDTQAAIARQGAELADKTAPHMATEESSGSGVASDLKGVAEKYSTGARNAYSRLRQAEGKPENIKPVKIGEGKIPDEVMAELDAVSTSLAGKNFSALTDAERSAVADTAKKLGIDATPKPETANMAFPVEMKSAKSGLTPILDQLLQEPADVLNRSRALPAIKAIVNGPDYVPASVAEDFLSGAKAIAREGVNAKTRFLAQKAIDAVQPLVDEAVGAGGKDAIDSLNEGRALTKAKYATLDTIDNLPVEPVQIYRKLASPGDTNINLLRDVKAKSPGSLPAVARATVEGLLEDGKTGGAAKALNGWNKLGASTKAELFSDPAHVEALDRYFKMANEVAASEVPPGMESPSGKIPAEPTEAYRKITRDKDAAITALREAVNASPEAIPQAARAKLQELVDAATAPEGTRPGPDAAFSAWNKLGENTKKILYPNPQTRADISNFLSTAKRVANAVDRNSSKTAYVNEAAHAVHMLKSGLMTIGAVGTGGTYVLGNYALAKILTTPGGARLLTEGLQISGEGAASLARRTAITNRLLTIAGPAARPIEESSNAAPKEAMPYKSGDTVTLKGVGPVKIKSINEDGSFEY